jgi:L-threonylcarbamoyladenylate synthase
MTDKSRIIVADADGIAAAAALLNAGGIVAVPTETVYGLAARAGDGAAVARIYAAKGRPSFNPLIVHVAGVAQAESLVVVDAVARTLMTAFWPGPLTLVLPRRAGAPIADLVTAGLPTLAVRCPAHPVMAALIAQCGPLAAPSANASGRLSSTNASHVAATLAVPILDAGPTAAGVESTIVAVEAGAVRLLRPGAVAVEAIEAVVGVVGAAGAGIVAPGMMTSHYAPAQPLRLGALAAGPDEFHIGFGAVAGELTLSAAGDLVEAAARLFAVLHAAEASGQARIAVAPVPETGLGVAINDRLRRAAAPR